MVAEDVYRIAKALPKEEFTKLYHILKSHHKPKPSLKKKLRRTSTVEECIAYLVENHCNKNKK